MEKEIKLSFTPEEIEGFVLDRVLKDHFGGADHDYLRNNCRKSCDDSGYFSLSFNITKDPWDPE